MKAVRYHQYGGNEVLKYEDVSNPTPGTGQVLVKVIATSFNPADSAVRAGYLKQMLPVTLPHTPGVDVAGTVAAVGEGVTGWAKGDAVVAFLPLNVPGASAEYVLAPSSVLVKAPKGIDMVAAAALPAPGLTAWQALFEHAKLKSADRVLINGAGGAVGGYAVQLAHRAGAKVTATASPRSAERVRGYGADRIIDYTVTPLLKAVEREFDVVLNLAATSAEETSELGNLVADGGIFVSATTPLTTDPGRGVRVARMGVHSDVAQLSELLALVAAGDLHIDVAERRPLAEVPAVHAQYDKGAMPGKVVIAI